MGIITNRKIKKLETENLALIRKNEHLQDDIYIYQSHAIALQEHINSLLETITQKDEQLKAIEYVLGMIKVGNETDTISDLIALHLGIEEILEQNRELKEALKKQEE